MVYISYMVRRRMKKVFLVLAITMVAVAGIIALQKFSQLSGPPTPSSVIENLPPEKISLIEKEKQGPQYVSIDVEVGPDRVILKRNCTVVAVSTSRSKAFSIKKGALNVTEMRPDAHDLLNDILSGYDIVVEKVVIDAYVNGIFYARMLLKKGDQYLDLDARPSDALAIAARLHTPVFANEEILNALGTNAC